MGISRILIVEDNQLVAADLSEIVISLGYEVAAVAESADRATHLAQELQPDLALMDISLEGERDGIGAAEEIRSRWRIPVVFLTAHGDVNTVARTTASGAFGHLTKPVRAEELQAAISIALSQHRAARELLREKTWLATLLSTIHEGVIAVDERGSVVYLNAEGERVTGWTLAEAYGRYVGEVYRLSAQSSQPEAADETGILTCIRTGSERPSRRMVLRARKGQEVLIEETIVPLAGTGALPGAVAIFRDLSESLKLEQAQKFESIGVLAGGIAHDFNNLLAVMIGNASLALQLLGDGPREGKFLDQVIKSGTKAAELTAQLLAYAGKSTLRKSSVDLGKAVNEMVELIGPTIPYRINISVNIPDDLPPIDGDSSQIQQIVMNLVINASEAIGDRVGMIEISAGTLTGDETNGNSTSVFLQVRDTGSGMDAETRLKVFDPFFTTKFTGRGLGLAAVAGIVHSHNGTISVESTPGIGSTFRVLLPVGSEALSAIPEKLDSEKLRGGETVLVVDDLETIRKFLGSALENCGYTVLAAENGKAALDVLAERRDIDLVLLDLSMPVMTGAEAAPQIRKLYPNVAICIMTGYNEILAGAEFADEELSQHFLQKPFAATSLAAKIRAVLDEPGRRKSNSAVKTALM